MGRGKILRMASLCLETSQEKEVFSRMGVSRNGFEVLGMVSRVRNCPQRPSPGKSDARPPYTFHPGNFRGLHQYFESNIAKQNDEESAVVIHKLKRLSQQGAGGKSPLIKGPGNCYLSKMVRVLDIPKQTKS